MLSAQLSPSQRRQQVDILKQAQDLWHQLTHEMQNSPKNECWITAIDFAGIYPGPFKEMSFQAPLFTWSTPAEAKISVQVFQFLQDQGVVCHLRPGTHDS